MDVAKTRSSVPVVRSLSKAIPEIKNTNRKTKIPLRLETFYQSNYY